MKHNNLHTHGKETFGDIPRSYILLRGVCVILRNPKGMETKLPMTATLWDTLVSAFYSSLVDLLIVLFGFMQPSATGAQVVEAESDLGE